MIGRHVSHFYIIRSLGSGGMGVVYEAQDTRLPRSVAIKFLKPALSKNLEAVRRFKREARLAASLNHPNICTLLDVDHGDGQFFIAMELLRGKTLRDVIGTRAFTTAEIIDLALQIADALGTAHDLGIMHRDITPGNIFLTSGGGVKLLDFGLAKQFAAFDADGPLTDELTQAGAVAGTVHYMAPEQFVADATLDHRCDLFSLGAVLYQLATGAKPFEARSRSEVIALIQEHAHTPIRQLAPQQSPQLARIIDTLLAKDPNRRYQSAWSLRAELEQARSTSPRESLEPDADAAVSLAVLPFQVVGNREPFVDDLQLGLPEDVASRLSGLPFARVAPRTTTRQLVGRLTRDAAKELGVQLFVEGSIQASERKVRVTAGLFNALSGQSLMPALRVDAERRDVLELQDDIAGQVVDAMSATIRQAAGRRYTQDAEAMAAFRRGQYHWKECFSGGWRPALEQFQYAVERDSRFALAHLALAVIDRPPRHPLGQHRRGTGHDAQLHKQRMQTRLPRLLREIQKRP